jgi:translation elongation factor EF-G
MVCIAVELTRELDLPTLIEGFDFHMKSGAIFQFSHEETNEHIIAGNVNIPLRSARKILKKWFGPFLIRCFIPRNGFCDIACLPFEIRE